MADIDERDVARTHGGGAPDATPDHSVGSGKWTELGWYRVVGALVVAPILLGAVRAAASGWIPTNDAAAAVLRAKHAPGAPAHWLGLYAWPSSQAIHETTYTAGTWQLWWMSVPTRLSGVTWGPLVSMAVLNSLFILAAGWFVRRRFGPRSAIAVLVFLGLFVWSIGVEAFSSPVPVLAVLAPFAAFCFVAWTLASGDGRALVFFAGTASYLVLCFPETTLLVPVIGGAALVLWVVSLRTTRRTDTELWPERRRRAVRSFLIALGVTVVLWLPPLIQQVAGDPGNLGHLVRASRELPTWMSLRRSVAALFSLFASFPFWLRGSTQHAFLTFTGVIPSLFATTMAAVGLLVAAVGAGVLATRRGDRPARAALLLAGVAFASTWLHLLRSPHGQYFLPVWVVAMFVTFAIVYALARALPERTTTAAPAVATVSVVLLAVTGLPARPIPHFTAGTEAQQQIAASLNEKIIPAVTGRGTVTVAPAFGGTYAYAAALIVALDDAGIPVCDRFIVSFQGYENPACDRQDPGVVVTYRSAATFTHAPPGETIVARHEALTSAERTEWKNLSLGVWSGVSELVASGSQLRVADRYRELIPDERTLAAEGGGDVDFTDDPGLLNTDFNAQAVLARAVVTTDAASRGRDVFVRLPGVSDADLLRWAKLREKLAKGVVVTVQVYRSQP